jgi:hypothetical protein
LSQAVRGRFRFEDALRSKRLALARGDRVVKVQTTLVSGFEPIIGPIQLLMRTNVGAIPNVWQVWVKAVALLRYQWLKSP